MQYHSTQSTSRPTSHFTVLVPPDVTFIVLDRRLDRDLAAQCLRDPDWVVDFADRESLLFARASQQSPHELSIGENTK